MEHPDVVKVQDLLGQTVWVRPAGDSNELYLAVADGPGPKDRWNGKATLNFTQAEQVRNALTEWLEYMETRTS